MFVYEKKLQYPVNIKNPNPALAKFIISQYGGPDGELGASLRDMEGAAIAHVCKREGVRCHAVKCVTNVAGKGSMLGQYEENTRRCLERLSNAMKELLG